MTGEPLFDRIARGGAAADLGPEPSVPAATAEALVAAIRQAASLEDPAAALAAWDHAGTLHTVESLDAALAEIAGRGPLAIFGVRKRGRILAAARTALRRTESLASLRLAAAFVGELGGAGDVDSLAALAIHPSMTLYGATALSVIRPLAGREALLRLLARTSGEQRVIVIDRLLLHAGQPAVRLALVRDALPGLSPEEAGDVAPAIAEACRCRELADDDRIEGSIRDAARAVLAAAQS